MKKALLSLKFLFILFSVLYFASCSKDALDADQIEVESKVRFTDVEVEELCKLGLDASQLDVMGNYIVGPMDFVINRDDLNSLAINPRHAAVGPEYVPHLNKTQKVKLYVDPSFTALGQDWTNKLYGAIAYLNNIEHSRVKIQITTQLGPGVTWLFTDEINSDDVPICFKNLGSLAAKAEYPLNECVGRYISVKSSSAASILYKDKLLIHELGHNFGMQHACAPQVNLGGIGCTNTPVNGTQIEETFVPQYPDHCDETSVMFTVLNANAVGTLPPGYYPYNIQPWMNDDDIFSFQGLYPITYAPFSFTVNDCEIVQGTGSGWGTSAPIVYRYHLDFIQNDFVPYQIDYELLNQNGQVVGSTTTYRYWAGYVDFDQIQTPDPTQDCLKMRITLHNYKKDLSNSFTTEGCCILN